MKSNILRISDDICNSFGPLLVILALLIGLLGCCSFIAMSMTFYMLRNLSSPNRLHKLFNFHDENNNEIIVQEVDNFDDIHIPDLSKAKRRRKIRKMESLGSNRMGDKLGRQLVGIGDMKKQSYNNFSYNKKKNKRYSKTSTLQINPSVKQRKRLYSKDESQRRKSFKTR